MSKKLYPFSMRREGHNIELVFNGTYNLMHDAQISGDCCLADKYEQLHERVSDVYHQLLGYCPNCFGVIMIPGSLLSKAKYISFMACQIRDDINLQYK